MKLALYLPNFRDEVTVAELEDLTALAEELDFDSVWTLDRIVVPEASDREELQYSFGMMEPFPKQLPVSSRGQWFQGWPLIPWLAAKTSKVRIGMSIVDTPYRAPGGAGGRAGHRRPPVQRSPQRRGRRRAGCRRSSRRPAQPTSSPGGTSPRAGRRSRSCRGSGPTTSSSTTASSPTSSRAGSGPSRSRTTPTRPSSSAASRTRSGRPSGSPTYDLAGWIGIQDTAEELARVADRPIQHELDALEQAATSMDDLEHLQHVLVRHHRRGQSDQAPIRARPPTS